MNSTGKYGRSIFGYASDKCSYGHTPTAATNWAIVTMTSAGSVTDFGVKLLNQSPKSLARGVIQVLGCVLHLLGHKSEILRPCTRLWGVIAGNPRGEHDNGKRIRESKAHD